VRSISGAATLSWGRYVSLRAGPDAVVKGTRYEQGTHTRVRDWQNCALSSATPQLVIRFVNERASV
jgi:hypothetical protein